MIREVHVGGARVVVDLARLVGQGGEADVFDLGDGRALKLWKGPDHPDLEDQPAEQDAARARLRAMPAKLAAFPSHLPREVAAPLDLARDRAGVVVGFTMPLVVPATPLYRLADPLTRRTTPGDVVVDLFRRLALVVSALHARGIVVGDLNDRNAVLDDVPSPRLLDADSFGFAAHPCTVFTEAFCDPRLTGAGSVAAAPDAPYDADADWFALAALLFQSLLAAPAFGGVHKPRDPAARIAARARSVRRVSVLHADVVYPKAALPPRTLPDDVLHFFVRTFEHDLRASPDAALDALRFTRCASCGLEHARRACPQCAAAVPVPADLRAARVASMVVTGRIVFASVDGGRVVAIVHDGSGFVREDGRLVLRGAHDARVRVLLAGDAAVFVRGSTVAVVRSGGRATRLHVDVVSGEPVVAASPAGQVFHVAGGRLLRHAPTAFDAEASSLVGEVLAQRTRIFVGASFGFGFYRAGLVTRAFTFELERRGLRDGMLLPGLRGSIIEARATLDEERAWLLVVTDDRGVRRHHVFVVDRRGAVVASAESTAGDASWLGTPPGDGGNGRPRIAVAAAGALFVLGDAGVVRVEPRAGALVVTASFAGTEPVAGTAPCLLASPDGLVLVEPSTITRLVAPSSNAKES